MEHLIPSETTPTNMLSLDQRGSRQWAQLILKLRWMGLEDEARRFERALSTIPSEERGTVAVGPFSTD
jgi:hypothetical protein